MTVCTHTQVWILLEPGKDFKQDIRKFRAHKKVQDLLHLVHFVGVSDLWGFPPGFDPANPGFNTSAVVSRRPQTGCVKRNMSHTRVRPL